MWSVSGVYFLLRESGLIVVLEIKSLTLRHLWSSRTNSRTEAWDHSTCSQLFDFFCENLLWNTVNTGQYFRSKTSQLFPLGKDSCEWVTSKKAAPWLRVPARATRTNTVASTMARRTRGGRRGSRRTLIEVDPRALLWRRRRSPLGKVAVLKGSRRAGTWTRWWRTRAGWGSWWPTRRRRPHGTRRCTGLGNLLLLISNLLFVTATKMTGDRSKWIREIDLWCFGPAPPFCQVSFVRKKLKHVFGVCLVCLYLFFESKITYNHI